MRLPARFPSCRQGQVSSWFVVRGCSNRRLGSHSLVAIRRLRGARVNADGKTMNRGQILSVVRRLMKKVPTMSSCAQVPQAGSGAGEERGICPENFGQDPSPALVPRHAARRSLTLQSFSDGALWPTGRAPSPQGPQGRGQIIQNHSPLPRGKGGHRRRPGEGSFHTLRVSRSDITGRFCSFSNMGRRIAVAVILCGKVGIVPY
jgi:hypothetical protein